VNLLSENALEGHPVAYFAPFYSLLSGTFKELYSVLNTVTTRKHDNQFIELATGGSIEFWSLENPVAGRSRKYKVAIIDEAAFNRNLWESWTEAIRPTLTDLKGSAWFMSTPKGKNDFYKLWMRGQTGEPDWMSWQMPTITNPFIDPSEIESARRDLPELAFAQEYLAEFNDNVANPFGLDKIRVCTGQMSNEPAVCFGIDLAKSFDWTVIIGLDRFGVVCYFERFQRPWNETKEIIRRLPRAAIKIDSTGVGDPITEDIQRERVDVHSFKYTSTSKQQLMEGLAAAIHQRRVIFPEGTIRAELESFEYQMTGTGVKYTAPPGLHDDCVNALALAWAMYVQDSGGQVKYSFL
jgi:phage FluMu gp28-like protein